MLLYSFKIVEDPAIPHVYGVKSKSLYKSAEAVIAIVAVISLALLETKVAVAVQAKAET